MKSGTIYTFRLGTGEEVVGEAINVSSAIESGVLLVTRPLIVDWYASEMQMDGDEHDPLCCFTNMMVAADMNNDVSFITRNLATLPVQASPAYTEAYHEYVAHFRSNY